MIEKGNLIVDDYVREVMRKARETITLDVEVVGDPDPAARLLEQHDEVATVTTRNGTIRVHLKKDVEDYTALPASLIEAGFRLKMFREEEVNLETAFMELTKGVQQ
jgi:ABC-2 type transport system ATP-binding protein